MNYDRDGLPTHNYNEGPFLKRRLHRSASEKMVAGVLGGIAETYGWNPTLVRLLFILSFLLPGPQAIFYLAAWIIMPKY